MKNNKKIILVSFATNDLKRSIRRLKIQAENSKFYGKIKIITPNDLSNEIQNKINILLKRGKKRGYAYWFWKPLILMELLKKINEGDILHYLDVGFHINQTLSKRMSEYVDFISQRNIWLLAFQYQNIDNRFPNKFNYPKREEYKYTKGDLLNYFKVTENKEITHSAQFSAGNFFIKKNSRANNFLLNWIDVFEKKFHLIDDTPSEIENFLNFVENRHDQSVFSILCKLNKVTFLSASECEWAEDKNGRYWEHLKDYPILAKRDKKLNLYKRFISRQGKNIRRMFNK